ncbi:MAG: LTA synthase family protein [Bacilli bacterium]
MTKKLNIYIFILITIIYMELVFKHILFGNLWDNSVLNIILLSFPISLGIYLLISLFGNKIILLIVLVVLSLIFVGQVVFFKIYDSFFFITAVGNANAVIEFFGFVAGKILTNMLDLFYLILPIFFFLMFRNNLFILKKHHYKFMVIILVLIFCCQFIAVAALPKKGLYAAYDLYYKAHVPTLMVKKLGLLTTMRLDIQRLIFHFDDENNIVKPDDDDNIKMEAMPGYNILNIDWDQLIAAEDNETVKMMHHYFKGVEPTKHNNYTGLFKGKNLIWILAEAFDSIAIDKEITPTLYKIAHEGFNFTNFYTPIFLSTIDGEYITKTSLMPKEGVISMYYTNNNYWPFSLGHLFKDLNYNTTAYHNGSATYYRRHLSHLNFGYEHYYACGQGLNINCDIWPQSDFEMMEATIPKQLTTSKPFMIYYITISGHLRYNKWNSMAIRNWEKVKHLNYSEPINCYLAQHVELDKALASLINHLEKVGKAEETVIAISSDHWPYGLTVEQLNEKANFNRDDFFERERMPFIIWHKGIKPTRITKFGSSIDIVPTLANLFGLKYDSRLLMGRDLFSEAKAIVIFANRSWITDQGRYDSLTKKYLDISLVGDNTNYIERINQEVYNRFEMSRLILDVDYYRKLFK